jgi:DEAD/DEAH box helicase domain-containing protein
MTAPIVLDVETKKTFREAESDKPSDLGISVVGTYSYATNSYKAYKEEQLDELFKLIEDTSLLIGFNIKYFDVPALSAYYVGNLTKVPTLDLMESVYEAIGRRIALDEFAKVTLGVQKSGHGLMAINYYREGKWDELISYCLDDVKITKELYEYGKNNGKIMYLSPWGKKDVPVDWKKVTKADSLPLTLGI